MAAVIICRDLGVQEIKSVTAPTFPPSIYHEVMGPDSMILVFWMLSYKPASSLPSFACIKRLFSSSSLSAIRVVSSAYLRLLILLAIWFQLVIHLAQDFTWGTLHINQANKVTILFWWGFFVSFHFVHIFKIMYVTIFTVLNLFKNL